MWGRAVVARQTHNLQVGGSNPLPATNFLKLKPPGVNQLTRLAPGLKKLIDMSNKIALKIDELSRMTATQLVEDERVENKFVTLYNSFHGSELGAQIYAKEKFNFLKLIQESPELQKCSKLSLYGCFIDVAYNGLSLESGAKPHAYLLPGSINIGTRQNPSYEKRASLSITGYGELVRRIRAGQVKHADNPVVVFASDKYERTTGKEGTIISHTAAHPVTDNTIIACFMRMVKPDGTVDFAFLEQDDFLRLKGYSERKNKGKANALYSSGPKGQIDKGFLIAKTIKHAFASYPKIKIGDFSKIDDPEPEAIDYGIEDTKAEDVTTKAFGPVEADVVEPETIVIEASPEEEDEQGAF